MLQLSAGQGPNECQVAVQQALRRLCREAQSLNVAIEVLEESPTSYGLNSALLSLSGDRAQELARQWVGTIQWNCASPLRPTYPRKNWFIGVQAVELPKTVPADNSIVFSTCKSSGKGGQHVNKTESAVHAKHIETGISVKVQTERSQFANKKLARELIAIKLVELSSKAAASHKQDAHTLHWNVERGNPVRVFRGLKFED
jgi:peptide chain release factor